MVRLSHPKERLSRLQERWSRPNPGLERDGPAPVHLFLGMAVPRARLHKSAQLRGSSKDSRYLQQNRTEFRHKVSETRLEKTIGLGLSCSVAVWASAAVFVWMNSPKLDQ